MPGDSRGIDELRRRVEKDPASIAFAQLAEELRKAGQYDEAVRVCRTGLERHPAYLAAHVTLGSALIGLQQYSEARTELEHVLHHAPDNLLAQRGMNELHESGGDAVAAAPAEPATAKPPSGDGGPPPEPPKPNLRIETAPPAAATVEPSVPAPVGDAAPAPAEALRVEASPAAAPEPSAFAPSEPRLDGPHVLEVSAPPNGGPPPEHPAIEQLEAWQAQIQADRAQRHR